MLPGIYSVCQVDWVLLMATSDKNPGTRWPACTARSCSERSVYDRVAYHSVMEYTMKILPSQFHGSKCKTDGEQDFSTSFLKFYCINSWVSQKNVTRAKAIVM